MRRYHSHLGRDIVLTPGDIEQMRWVPELVFINCCHLGKPGAGTDRGALAANLGMQFIRMGVRAVVAAGWAVDDAAALAFAGVAPAQTTERVVLNVYPALETDQLRAYQEAFNRQHPNIEIRWTRDSTGIITARLLAEPRGSGGFGYDPLVWIDALGASVADLEPGQKNAHSHRARAMAVLVDLLRERWRLAP